MSDVRVRDVTAEDVVPCRDIEASCFEPSEAAPEDKIRKRQELYPEGFLIAELEGEVIGFINSGATNEADLSREEFKDMIGHDAEGRNIVIFSIAVAPAYQGIGVSRLLMAGFIQRAQRLSKQAVLLLCKQNLVSYYEKSGFENLGKSASTHGGFQWHEMQLVL